ncbi:dicarboxylate/amino acid:cation symporter [Litoribacter alkaliphilus]|uniref:Dicarboxylate/amino acid:cation symporter n=1 Tax=Litoribacter ruber TaxID=702568 RepID=A0AAP2CJD3_9BACT|nr:dicarboxylate/amino acid:cation symporter [Litoribacter alkaliphilus]MBS9524995.1 dicarboxylate/amino acid:cation symporter [Litoribacter alkaliphilus]
MKKIGLLPRLIIAIIIGILIGSYLPEMFTAVLATFNGIFGNFLGFAIPLIIIGFIVPGIGDLGRGAGRTLALTAMLAYGFTVFSGLLTFGVGSNIFKYILTPGSLSIGNVDNPEHSLVEPLFVVEMAPVMGVMTALLIAFTLGIGIAAIEGNGLKKAMNEFQQIITKMITAIIIPLLPFHVMGIFANIAFAGQVGEIMGVFFKVFIVIILLQFTVIVSQYLIAGTVSRKNPFSMIRNMMTAYFTALGTQSSAATIPVTLGQSKKNGVRGFVADFVVPLCATIHLSGSTITITACALAIMVVNGMDVQMMDFLPFILALGVTMIAAPGVPGGAVMAALGLLQTMLGFNDVLISLMIALYLAQDSFGTATNITGDGAIAVIMDKLTKKEKKEAVTA